MQQTLPVSLRMPRRKSLSISRLRVGTYAAFRFYHAVAIKKCPALIPDASGTLVSCPGTPTLRQLSADVRPFLYNV
jgi:hypothetical protein